MLHQSIQTQWHQRSTGQIQRKSISFEADINDREFIRCKVVMQMQYCRILTLCFLMLDSFLLCTNFGRFCGSSLGSTTTDREPTAPNWMRRTVIEIFDNSQSRLAKALTLYEITVTESLCDEITSNRWFAVS